MKTTISTFAIVLLAGSAWAGGSNFKSNVVPILNYCSAGTCSTGAAVCATNADCDLGSLSPKSKLSLSGAGRLKAQLKGVVDSAGMPASGDYIVGFYLSGQTVTEQVIVKATVADGIGKLDADISSFMGPANESSYIFAPYLFNPPAVPADCPGGSSAADIEARQGDTDCFTGYIIGVIGISTVPAVKSAVKSNVAPIVDSCSGTCAHYGDVCATNADCGHGSFSPKSKMSIDGTGRLKMRLKDVLDTAGMPATGDYIFYTSLFGQTSQELVTVKLAVTAGEAKVDVDLSSFMPPANEGFFLGSPQIHLPPAVPADCPGANTAAEIAARQGDPDCFSNYQIGAVGLTSAP